MDLIASIITSYQSSTIYAVQCGKDTDAADCGIGAGIVLTQGPRTAGYTMSDGTQDGANSVLLFTGYFDCSLKGTSTAICTESFGGEEANFPGSSTETLTGTDFTYQTATLTGSTLNILGAAPASSTTGSTASSTSGSGATQTGSNSNNNNNDNNSGSTSGSGSKETGSNTSNGGNGDAKSTRTSTGGMAMITGNAQWVMGGAALAAALL